MKLGSKALSLEECIAEFPPIHATFNGILLGARSPFQGAGLLLLLIIILALCWPYDKARAP